MPTEMQSTSKSSQADQTVSELDSEALAAIRNLLDTQPKAQTASAETGSVSDCPAETAAQPRRPAQQQRTGRSTAQGQHQSFGPDGTQPKRQARSARQSVKPEGGRLEQLKAAVRGYRPTPRHIVLAALGLLVLFRPWLVLGVIFLSLFVMTAVFLILGYDGFWHRVMGLARWYARRRPSRAAEVHRKLDAFAMKWDAILDRFPEGSVDGLYLPDFGELATSDLRHEEALDRRFANIRESEV